MKTRRRFLVAFGIATLTPRGTLAQAKKAPVVIGWLHLGSRETDMQQLTAFKEGLAALGYKEGQHFVIQERWANSRSDRMQPLAEELAAKKPAVIVPVFGPPTRAAVKAAPTTPIVLVGVGDPVGMGLVSSLARPGGMVTGLSNVIAEVREKYIELLVGAVPTLKRIGVLHSGAGRGVLDRSMDSARRFAAQRSIEIWFEGAASAAEIEPAVSRLSKQGAQALVVFPSGLFSAEAARIAKLARDQRWPLVGSHVHMQSGGALLSYGADQQAIFRRAAYYVDRILKGAKPGDLPIEQPMTFELAVNLKTAQALGITIPPEIMVQATRVIR